MQEIFEKIGELKPKYIFIGGKTSTGKSTFAFKLRDELAYRVVELDKVVNESVVKAEPHVPVGDVFLSVYRGGKELGWMKKFVDAARAAIRETSGSGVVVEGVIAHNETLLAIMENKDFMFLYFHPNSLKKYEEMLTKRFTEGAKKGKTGLPKHFWHLVDADSFDEYLNTDILNDSLRNSLNAYAKESLGLSQERLEYFIPLPKPKYVIQ